MLLLSLSLLTFFPTFDLPTYFISDIAKAVLIYIGSNGQYINPVHDLINPVSALIVNGEQWMSWFEPTVYLCTPVVPSQHS